MCCCGLLSQKAVIYAHELMFKKIFFWNILEPYGFDDGHKDEIKFQRVIATC
jgi:hypothetical protein